MLNSPNTLIMIKMVWLYQTAVYNFILYDQVKPHRKDRGYWINSQRPETKLLNILCFFLGKTDIPTVKCEAKDTFAKKTLGNSVHRECLLCAPSPPYLLHVSPCHIIPDVLLVTYKTYGTKQWLVGKALTTDQLEIFRAELWSSK
jgi:hypothetical protein